MNEFPFVAGRRVSIFARFWGWLVGLLRLAGWRKLWRMVGRVCRSVLATLIALVLAEENLRGRWAWSRYKHKLEAQGEARHARLHSAACADDQNFAMTLSSRRCLTMPRIGRPNRWRDTNGLALHSLG
jgi:hypothetical protein